MGILKQARERAADVAREAADATARAAGAAAARAGDPATRERVKQGLVDAGHTAGGASRAAADATAHAARTVADRAGDPATQERVRSGVKLAGDGVLAAGRGTATGVRKVGRGARTMIERIDPGLLAEVVVKATALQERTNARLRARGSVYRIGELQVTASLPPGISFSIVRLDDPEHVEHGDAAGLSAGRSSTELLADEAAEEGISSLDPVEEAVEEAGEAADGDEGEDGDAADADVAEADVADALEPTDGSGWDDLVEAAVEAGDPGSV